MGTPHHFCKPAPRYIICYGSFGFYRMYRVTNVMDNIIHANGSTDLLHQRFQPWPKTRNAGLLLLFTSHALDLTEPGPRHLEYNCSNCCAVVCMQDSPDSLRILARMALFLLRSSYRMLMAVCFLLGVNVFIFYVLSQGGGLSLGEM